MSDFRYGLRMMANSPGVSVVAVAALGLGIGANTAIFSVVNTVLLRKLSVPDPDQVVSLVHRNERRNITSGNTPYADVCEWRRQLRSFEGIAAHQQASMNLANGDEPERVFVGKVNWTFFPMLRVRPVLGRDFAPEEDRPGAGRVVVLTNELWKRRFGADPEVAGKTVSLDGEPYRVIGVLPPRFRFIGERMDLYAPLALSEARGPIVPVRAYGRLKQGVTRQQAQPELDAITAATIARFPPYKGWRLQTGELTEWIAPDVRTSLWVLLGAVGLVLLIGCANVASLLLSRAAARRREIAIRAALGAGRGRLTRQLLAESAPLGVLGGGLGLLLAWWGVKLLPHFEIARIPRLSETQVDGTVLAFTAGVSLLTCMLFGLAPAAVISRAEVHEALKEGGRGGALSVRGSRLRAALVVWEVGLALLLSIGATLMIRTFYSLSAVDPGFVPENLLSASIDLPRGKYRSGEQVVNFYREALERVRSMPGVTSVCLTNSLPLGGNYFRADFLVEGRDYPDPREKMLNYRTVDASYFRTMRIPLRKGRYFTEQDREGAPPALIISEATARRFFGDADPIGRRMGQPPEWMTIVGVVADIKHTDVSLGPDTEVLLPFAQKPAMGMTVVVRVDPRMYPDPMRFTPVLRRAITTLDKNQAVHRVSSMERIMSERLAPRRLNMVLLCLFAVLALVLAALGIYGVLAFSVERRRHEIGVRMALGAQQRDVVGIVVRQGLLLTAAGLALGIAAAIGLTRLLGSLLYGVSATDPVIYAGAAVVLAGVAALASYVPARRAVRVDPVVALRWE